MKAWESGLCDIDEGHLSEERGFGRRRRSGGWGSSVSVQVQRRPGRREIGLAGAVVSRCLGLQGQGSGCHVLQQGP